MEGGSASLPAVSSCHQAPQLSSGPTFPSHVSRLPCSDIRKIAAFTLDALLEASCGNKDALYSVAASPIPSRCFRRTDCGCLCGPQTCANGTAVPSHPLPLHPELSFEVSLFRNKSVGEATSLHTPAAGAPISHFSHLRASSPSGRCASTLSHVPCYRGAAGACESPCCSVIESLFPLPQREIPQNKQGRTTARSQTVPCGGEHSTDRAGAPAAQRFPGGRNGPGCGSEKGSDGEIDRGGNVLHGRGGDAVSLHFASRERRGSCTGDTPAEPVSDSLSLHFSSHTHSGARHMALDEERGARGQGTDIHGHRRFLVALGGLPGSGKSTLGRRLSAEINRLWSEGRRQWQEEQRRHALTPDSERLSSAERSAEPWVSAGPSDLGQEGNGGREDAHVTEPEPGKEGTDVPMQSRGCSTPERKSVDGDLERTKQENMQGVCVAVGMDGFHFTRAQLSQFPDPAEAFRRRGAAWTFDMPAFWRTLHDVKYRPDRSIPFPTFDHSTKDPVPGGCVISPETRIVIVEGLYLCLSEAGDQGEATASMERPRREWFNHDDSLFDVLLFLHTPLDEVVRRVIQRHVASGICETESQARERWTGSDAVNAAFILSHVDTAHLNAVITHE